MVVNSKNRRYSPDKLFAIVDAQGRRMGWLADQTGYHYSALSRMKSGERAIPPRFANEAARALGVPVEIFLETQDA